MEILPKIVFFDIDDTLYRKYTDTLRPSVALAMEALKKRGILTAIATGRPIAAFPEKIKNLIREQGIDLIVSINGQYIEFRGGLLKSYPLDIDDMKAFCRDLDGFGLDYAFVGHDGIAASADSERVRNALSHIVSDYPVDKDYFLENPVYQILVFADDGEEKQIQTALDACGFKSVRWHPTAVDVLYREASKARGIEKALAQLGIGMEEAMAFGDGLNDVEMLSLAGFGVAMGNGCEEAKQAARFVCPSVDEDGVFEGLKSLGIID